jgi:hypothetical protein
MISRSTSCGLAPTQTVSIESVGICTSGVSCTGIDTIDKKPNSKTKITPTAILTGLRTKVSMRFIFSHLSFVICHLSLVESGVPLPTNDQ